MKHSRETVKDPRPLGSKYGEQVWGTGGRVVLKGRGTLPGVSEITLPTGVLSGKAVSVDDLKACLPGLSRACPKGHMRHKAGFAPSFLAAYLQGDFLGTSKDLVPAQQAEDYHLIVENNDTDPLKRAECNSPDSSEALLIDAHWYSHSIPSWLVPTALLRVTNTQGNTPILDTQGKL